MKSLAAVAFAPRQALELCEIDIAPLKPGEVLVKLIATGVCHTDAFTLSGQDPEGIFPSILGHEGAGIVVETSTDVKSLKAGDHVIPLYIPECKICKYCTSQKTNLCQAIRQSQGQGLMPDGSSRFSLKDKPLFHYMGTSTFSEYTVVPEIALAKISPKAPLEKVCLLGCGITTGIGAVLKTAKVRPASTVAVFGLGAIGLSVVQGALIAQASRIIAIDINESKFELARQLGATDCINPQKLDGKLVDYLINLTDGGVDYSFECVGKIELMREALECCHKGWGVSTIIGVAGAGQEISTRPFQLVTGRIWQGCAFGGVRGRSELPIMVDNYLTGDIKIDPYISHQMPFSKINEAFELMAQGKSIRTVLRFS